MSEWTPIENEIASLRLAKGWSMEEAAEWLSKEMRDGRIHARASSASMLAPWDGASKPSDIRENLALPSELWAPNKLGNTADENVWLCGAGELPRFAEFRRIEIKHSINSVVADEKIPAIKSSISSTGGSNEREFWTVAITVLCIEWANDDFMPKRQKDVVERLKTIVADKFDEYPSDSALKERARIIYPLLKEEDDKRPT